MKIVPCHPIIHVNNVLLDLTHSGQQKRSSSAACQELVRIGMKYHIETGLIFPPMDRAGKREDRIYVLLKTRVTTAYFWLSLLGSLNSVTDAIPLGRLHLRLLQIYWLAHWAPVSRDTKVLIPVKHDLFDNHLKWWLNRNFTGNGRVVSIRDEVSYQSPGDASHQKCLVFKDPLRGKSVMLMTDNATVVAIYKSRAGQNPCPCIFWPEKCYS